MFRAALSVLTLAALAVVLALPAEAKFTGLKGEVGPGFQIKVTKNGAKVRTIKAGSYQMQIEDQASIHNFRLKGPGINKATGVAFVGKKMWTVRLKPGVYKFQCDPHATSMQGSFKVVR